MKSTALHPIVYLKYGERSRGGSIANLFLTMIPFPINLSTIAVIYSLFKPLLLLPGVLGSCVGDTSDKCSHDRALVPVRRDGGGAGRAR